MLIKSITQQFDIPGEAGEKLTLRRLSWKEAEAATEAKQAKSLRLVRDLGADLIKSIQDSEQAAQEAPVEQRYDKSVVLRSGIVGWTYEDAVTPENIELLDDSTAEFAFKKIIELTEGAGGKPAKKS
jgi:hypothetical protein